jgi:transcriptional regulator with XRE-family HTH domain
MVNAAQIRAARALLGWPQDRLCQRARISRRTLTAIENDEREVNPTKREQVVEVLEKAGVEFRLEENGKFGVLLQGRGSGEDQD